MSFLNCYVNIKHFSEIVGFFNHIAALSVFLALMEKALPDINQLTIRQLLELIRLASSRIECLREIEVDELAHSHSVDKNSTSATYTWSRDGGEGRPSEGRAHRMGRCRRAQLMQTSSWM